MPRVLNHKVWPHTVSFVQIVDTPPIFDKIDEWLNEHSYTTKQIQFLSVPMYRREANQRGQAWRAYFKDESLALMFALKFV